MKNLKMLYIALIALVAGAFGACTNEFEPGPQMPGPQVSFLSSNPTKVEFTGAASENTQKLTLTRIEKEEELVVDLLIEVDRDYATIFSIPETVTFAAGEATTELVYTVNQSRLEESKEYTVSFLVADEMMSTPYGYTEWKVNHVLNQWELMTDANGNNAKGKFRGLPVMDNQISGPDFAAPEIDVDIYKHKKESKYMIKEPWPLLIVGLFESMGVTVTVDQVKASFDYTAEDVIIDVSDPTNVTVPLQAMGLNDVHGFWVDGYTLGDFFYQGYGGTLEDGVITFPAGSFFCNCGLYRDYGVPDNDPDYCAGANGSGQFRVILPGYEAADYSLGVAYDGMDVAADNKTTTAKFKFNYGADVTGIKYMIVDGNVENNPTEALTTLFAGEDENIKSVENFVQGGKEIGIKVGMESGVYTMVAAPADKNGDLRAKEAIAYSFYFKGIGEAEEHPCEFEALMVLPSEYNPNLTESYPDQSYLFVMARGKELSKVSYYFDTTATISTWPGTPEELVASYGQEFSADFVAMMNEDMLVTYFPNLEYDTEYTWIVVATNNYGESKTVVATKKTSDITYDDYTGELVIGKYLMSCTVGAGTENEVTYNNVFKVVPNGTTGTDFLVQNIGYDFTGNDIRISWIATYDATVSTLTLNGKEYGYEQLGNQFGADYLYIGQAKTKALRFCSHATDKSEGKDPLVLTVDPTTKVVNGMQNFLFALPVIDLTTNEQIDTYGNFYGASTTIAPYVASNGDASSASVMSVGAPSVKTLMQSVKKASTSKKLQSLKTVGIINNTKVSGVRTVKPSVVETYTPTKAQGFKLKTNIKAFAR